MPTKNLSSFCLLAVLVLPVGAAWAQAGGAPNPPPAGQVEGGLSNGGARAHTAGAGASPRLRVEKLEHENGKVKVEGPYDGTFLRVEGGAPPGPKKEKGEPEFKVELKRFSGGDCQLSLSDGRATRRVSLPGCPGETAPDPLQTLRITEVGHGSKGKLTVRGDYDGSALEVQGGAPREDAEYELVLKDFSTSRCELFIKDGRSTVKVQLPNCTPASRAVVKSKPPTSASSRMSGEAD